MGHTGQGEQIASAFATHWLHPLPEGGSPSAFPMRRENFNAIPSSLGFSITELQLDRSRGSGVNTKEHAVVIGDRSTNCGF